MSGQKGKVHLGPNVSSSAHYRGCVVDGSGAMAAIYRSIIIIIVLGVVFLVPNFSFNSLHAISTNADIKNG